MRMWAFTLALFLGLATWGADLLDNNFSTDQPTITDGGGADDGIVTAMEDPVGPPKP